jgi:two-component system response regulator WspF
VAALDGDPLRPATAHVAALDRHLVVTPDRLLRYVDEPRESIHRPSVDVLFASLATQNRTGLAILLTGMGRDGAEGLLQLRRSGWTTVAQDMKSSTVWGMPRAAIELGGADLVLPAEAIAPTIEAFVVRAARLR